MREPPPISDELRAAARANPGRWLYVIDEYFDPDGEVPPFGVAGAWQVDERGQIAEFRPNPHYRPSPLTLGYPEPTDELDAAIQFGSTGYLDDARIAPLFMDADVLTGIGEDDRVPLFGDHGDRAAHVYSARAHLPATLPDGVRGWRDIRGGELVTLLPADVGVAINPATLGVHLPRADFDRLRP
ncbi:type VII secretion system-associated protein [Nonomuraea turcica]|uniref:type VII secretion system-associated protein n=1 Tax=Nonomuraea sp. G32 TaxID=3067274 RepID=UPI00273B399A|nr:type VII secretion system-associated protein [Nonomuraea sp. G32]MDP4506028.1 type VII secretion system-associated protein [Nonomuraea sp. G32]